ncbi:hypothetical protein Cadr_000020606 [Camelus dromedarius]|uniref:Uncharacterized protein n=1 Tax=Camelus dromedarius TaxID=9838 RepID=A0A5N4CZZ9_CAMDR|nr:hypothetical protein Cadr_000020606 [Camelus dromedarius]
MKPGTLRANAQPSFTKASQPACRPSRGTTTPSHQAAGFLRNSKPHQGLLEPQL